MQEASGVVLVCIFRERERGLRSHVHDRGVHGAYLWCDAAHAPRRFLGMCEGMA